ncbi:hypothetical protein GCM10010495_81730 [Kitasatospora herbaricolor]|nr:hypothetical protein GCM10010252_77930 [Streptomyces aureoverticillatus]GGV51963.1 hypothetical protein GCM10010495_81730 [Kitasatospora herbaricolor]
MGFVMGLGFVLGLGSCGGIRKRRRKFGICYGIRELWWDKEEKEEVWDL